MSSPSSLSLDSPMQNIVFVKEIEKHGCIYNCHIAEYNRKEITDAAWRDIAKKMKSTVMNCKEKWRNLRTVFIRKEKLRAKKYTRPYYLTPHLKFLLPYIKLRSGETLTEEIEENGSNNSGNQEERFEYQEALTDPDEDQKDEIEEKYTDPQFVGVFSDAIDEEQDMLLPYDNSNNVASTSTSNYASSVLKKRKVLDHRPKVKDVLDGEYYEESKSGDYNHWDGRKVEDPRWCFLKSLMPDLHEMSDVQMRKFKRGALDLVDSILEENL